MREKIWFVYVVSCGALAISFWIANSRFVETSIPGITRTIIFALIILTLFSLKLLLGFLKLPRLAVLAVAILACVDSLLYSQAAALPVLIVLILDILDEYLSMRWVIVSAIVALIILYFVLTPSIMLLIFSIVISAGSLYSFSLIQRNRKILKNSMSKSEEIEELRRSVQDGRKSAQNMEYTTKLLERNRLASRIHDEVGHGMSGSILLLEGANTVIDKDPAKAKETVSKAIDNLRGSVDKIRSVLREERAETAESNLSRIEKELLSFQADHPEIKTSISTEGNLDEIPTTVWLCVYENLREALTNVLKHSNGNVFRIAIENKNKLLSIEFADNGKLDKSIVNGHGIGLQGMEERTALCYGRCFFNGDENGFSVRMNFPVR
jgi:signal transduction histidine kinase